MPDPRVIGKIASTLEEIRDILLGQKTSKLYNSLQSIASTNISIKELMTELVDITKEDRPNKKVSIKDAMFGGAKDKIIKDAGKSLKGIQNILYDIGDYVKSISKKTNLRLTGGSDDKKVIGGILKDATRDTKSNKILSMINVVSKLKEFSIKDFLTANKKIKKITKIYERLVKSFDKIGDAKKVDKVNDFALKAIEIVKKVSKIGLLPNKLVERGVDNIDRVMFSKHGLIHVIDELDKKKNKIKKSKKTMKELFKISGMMLGVVAAMTVVAVLGIPAMLGAVIMSGVVLVFGLAFSAIGLLAKHIKKGDKVMKSMMTSMILAGAGLLLINKATKDLEWEQLAKAGTAILGFGLITALLGIPLVAGFIGIGSVAMMFMSLGLISIAGGIAIFGKLVTDNSIDKVSYGIPKVFDAMTSIFGDTKEKGAAGFGDSVFGIITGCLKLGGAVFAAGALMIIGIALGFTGLCLRSWENFNIRAIDNVSYAISTLDDVLGLGLKKNRNEDKGGFFGQVGGLLSDIGGFASTLLQCSKTFFAMGTLLFAGFVLGLIKEQIEKWESFKPNSLDNIESALTKLDDMFNLGLIGKRNVVADVALGAIDMVTGTWQIASSLLKAGKTFVSLGTLMAAVYVTDVVIDKIKSWSGFNDKPLDKVLDAFERFGDFFGIDFGGKRKGFLGKLLGGVGDAIMGGIGFVTGPFELGATLMKSGGQMAKLGVLSTAVGVVDKLINVMIKAGNNAKLMNGSLETVFGAFDSMIEYFFNDDRLDTSMWDNIKNVGIIGIGGLLAGPIGMLGASLLTSDSRKTKLSILTTAVGIVDKMADAIIKMGQYSGDVKSGLATTFEALDLMTDYLFGKSGSQEASALSRVKSAMDLSKTQGFFGWSDGSDEVETQLEVLTSCVGIVGTMATALKNMEEMAPDINASIDTVFYALGKITEYFFDKPNEEGAGALSKIRSAMKKNQTMGFFGMSDGSDEINTQLEIIVGCVGVVSQVADVIKSMSNTDEVDQSMQNLFTSLDNIINYFTKYDEKTLDNIEDIADEMPDILEYLEESVNYIKKMDGSTDAIKNFADVAMPKMNKIILNLNGYTEKYLKNVRDVADELPRIFKNVYWVLDYMKGDYNDSIENISKLGKTLSSLNLGDINGIHEAGHAFNIITDGLVKYSNFTNITKINKLNGLMSRFNALARVSNPFVFNSVTKVIDKINAIDIEKAQALTDTFKSFTSINTLGGFFFNFKKQVGLFTEACVRLVDAINGNTDALTSENIMDEAENASTEPSKKAISIANTKELAEMIAEAISGNSFGGGFGEALPVELRINGEGGDSWVIRRY